MKDFQEFLREKRAWYKNVGRVYCRILNADVHFNSKGFYHLRYDSFGKARNIKEQKYKLGLLPLVIPVIKNATNVREARKMRQKSRLYDGLLWCTRFRRMENP